MNLEGSIKRISFKLIWILLATLLLGPVELWAQGNGLDKKISIHLPDTSVVTILEEISKLGGVKFSYSHQRLPVDKKVSVEAVNKSISSILNEICQKLNLQYKFVEQQVILKAAKKGRPTGDVSEGPKHILSGYVRDASNGEMLLFATVYVKELNTGVSTNAFGFYSLTLPEGLHHIGYTYVGYRDSIMPVELKENRKLNMDLDFNMAILKTVEVTDEVIEEPLATNRTSEVTLTTKTIDQMPGFLGEVELIKSLQSMPGIQNHSDGSSYFYVRGGNKDQNLILIDDAPVYNPSHLLGFFSSFTPDAIKDVEIYKGDIPLPQGGALSSVIDVRTKDGNMKRHSFGGSLGIIATKFTLEGPLKKDISSFFLSYRRSHIGWLVPKSVRDEFKLYFSDFNGKLNYKLNDKNRVYLSVYTGNDFYGSVPNNFSNFGIGWDNSALTVRWNRLFNDKLFSNLIFNVSEYDYYLYLTSEGDIFWNESIENVSLKNDFTYYMNPNNTIRFGGQTKGHNFNPGNIETLDTSIDLNLPWVPTSTARLWNTYASNEQKVSNKVSFNYGIRFNVWQSIGSSEVYLYDDNHNVNDTLYPEVGKPYNSYFNTEPRFSIRYALDSSSTFKAAYSRTIQYIQLLSNSTSPFTTLDVWLPAGSNIKPQRASQWVLGYYNEIKSRSLELNAEGFYRRLNNQIDYDDHANMLLNPLLEGELRFGKSWSYGVELLLKKKHGRFQGWVAYTLSKTKKRTSGINNDQPYNAYQDRPNDLSIHLNYKANPRWDLNMNWMYATGAAITTPVGFYEFQGSMVPVYGEKNNDRLPDYHRLDLSASFRLNRNPEKRFKHWVSLSLFNAYGRRNPISVNFNKIEDADKKLVVPVNTLSENDLVPSTISLLGAIPSVNYKFKFN